jgi:glucose/arabinose dehydrogenase
LPRTRRLLVVLALVALLPVVALPHDVAAAVSLPSGFSETTYESGFADRTTAMAWSPDGRLFVSEKTGALRVVKNGNLLSQPFLRLNVDDHSERGLLGIAFDPSFATNRFVYVYYTTASTVKNRVSRFTANSSNPDQAQSGTEKILLDNIPSDAGFHNGGALSFGPDGKLYVSVGDSGTSSNGQSLSTLAGKLLRINKDGTIPTDNPFAGQSGRRGEIWAYGLRNPYTFAFKPGTSLLYLNDVGNNKWEEINRMTRGGNYGWPTCEGACSTGGMINPIYAYSHTDGPGKAITGAAFYDGDRFPSDYAGDYFFGDYVGGYIKRLDVATGRVSAFATGVPSPVDLRVGPDGALYYLSVGAKMVGRISFGGSGGPTPTPTPTRTPTPAGQPPRPVIDLPEEGLTFRAGEAIGFSGSARDPEDGAVPASRLTWEVVFHHDTHTHPFVEPFSGSRSGSFVPATRGETSDNVWYRIHLTATDSAGNTAEVTRDVRPRKSTVSLTTSPSGLGLTLDGAEVRSPFAFVGVEGVVRDLVAPRTQNVGGKAYEFVSWSDGGAATHSIATPTSDSTYTASYRVTGESDPTSVAGDTFSRPGSQGWGRSDVGGDWLSTGIPGALTVADHVGLITVPRTGAGTGTSLSDASARDVDVRVRVRVDRRASGGPFYAYLIVRSNNGDEYRPKLMFQQDGTIAVQAGRVVDGLESSVAPAVVVPGLHYAAGQFIWIRAKVSGTNPTTISIKAWAAGATEPAAWQFVATDNRAELQRAGGLGLRAYISSRATNSPVTFGFDDYRALTLP